MLFALLGAVCSFHLDALVFRRAARVRSAFDFFWHPAVVLNVRWSFATRIFTVRASAFAVGENVDIFFAGT